jgi:hypothetical protein
VELELYALISITDVFEGWQRRILHEGMSTGETDNLGNEGDRNVARSYDFTIGAVLYNIMGVGVYFTCK